MWTVAVVDRLVSRNTSLSVQAAAQIFVEAWTAFVGAIRRRAAIKKLATEGRMSGVVITKWKTRILRQSVWAENCDCTLYRYWNVVYWRDFLSIPAGSVSSTSSFILFFRVHLITTPSSMVIM